MIYDRSPRSYELIQTKQQHHRWSIRMLSHKIFLISPYRAWWDFGIWHSVGYQKGTGFSKYHPVWQLEPSRNKSGIIFVTLVFIGQMKRNAKSKIIRKTRKGDQKPYHDTRHCAVSLQIMLCVAGPSPPDCREKKMITVIPIRTI